MTNNSLAYHLRPNKAIDRGLFLDLLSRISSFKSLSGHTYIGFGGPFLEDFKLIHKEIGITKMISVEADTKVHMRQKFNAQLNCVRFINKSSTDFFANFSRSRDENLIVWFDYESPKQLNDQLEECREFVSQMSPFDILRVTLNSNPTSFTKNNLLTGIEVQKERRENLVERISSDFTPSMLLENTNESNNLFTHRNFPYLLISLLEKAIKKGVSYNSSIQFLPLASFTYKDGQEMLTFTGVALKSGRKVKETFLSKSKIMDWQFSNLDWSPPKIINTPIFSVKERISLDGKLPHYNRDEICKDFSFLFDSVDDNALTSYIEYSKYLPYFSKVMV